MCSPIGRRVQPRREESVVDAEFVLVIIVVGFFGQLYFMFKIYQAMHNVQQLNTVTYALLLIAGSTSPEAEQIVNRTKKMLDSM